MAAKVLAASSTDWSVFQNLVMASSIWPFFSGATNWLGDARWRAGSFSAATPFWLQMSSLPMSTSVRIGMEPFLALKATCTAGELATVANSCCALMALASLVLGNTNTSPSIMYGALAPQPGKQPKSLPAVCFATANSPLAQSPMIWKPALLEITMLVATFQSRLGEPAST